jgi:hypothetical protein
LQHFTKPHVQGALVAECFTTKLEKIHELR